MRTERTNDGQTHTNCPATKTPAADSSGAAAGQLALWLGTSQGSVLLVHLQMPDSEDNRVLQLQSVNAEPIREFSARQT